MIKINKHENEQCNKEREQYEFDNITALRYADGKFYRESDYFTSPEELNQDAYMMCHDIIADLLFEQLNGNNYAYTSSSMAGHHNMDESGTLIFINGRPCYVWDDEEDNEGEQAFNSILTLDEW